MKRKSSESEPDRPATSGITGIPSQTSTTATMAHEKSQKRMGKRPGRKPSKIDQRAKLERSRQSARECRARKKLRYQYLEELVASREKAVFSLREEVELYKRWSVELDRGIIPDGLLKLLAHEEVQPRGSPPSYSSTPTASPSSVDTDHMTAQSSVSPVCLHHVGPLAGLFSGHYQSGQLVQGHSLQQQTEQGRRQLTRQPAVSQQLSSMNRGCRSVEESSCSPSSSSTSATAAAANTTVYRSGSVPNLTATLGRYEAYPPTPALSTTTTTMVLSEDTSTSLNSMGFLPELSVLSKVISNTEAEICTPSNIPTVVTQHSPPSPTSKSGAVWTWDSPQTSVEGPRSRTYPYTCASSVVHTPHSTQQSLPVLRGEGFCSSKPESPLPNFLISRSTVSVESVASSAGSVVPGVGSVAPSAGSVVPGVGSASGSAVSFSQRPRSSSDLARRVTSSMMLSSPSTSLSQQNLPGLFDTPVTTFSSVYPMLADSVTTCLANTSILQDTAPVCMSSELSASISEPLPHWYSFLDDLENVTSFSARQGAFSEAGTPGSSRARSGACTPSSVDSPYSQQLMQQQPLDSGSDGNIPNIISDLLGQPHSS